MLLWAVFAGPNLAGNDAALVAEDTDDALKDGTFIPQLNQVVRIEEAV